MKRNEKRSPQKKNNPTKRKRDSNETWISIPEYRTNKTKYSPEITSIAKYPYHHNAQHHQI